MSKSNFSVVESANVTKFRSKEVACQKAVVHPIRSDVTPGFSLDNPEVGYNKGQ